MSWGTWNDPLVAGPRDSTVIGVIGGDLAVFEVAAGKLVEASRFARPPVGYDTLMARSGDRLYVTGDSGTLVALSVGCVGVDL